MNGPTFAVWWRWERCCWHLPPFAALSGFWPTDEDIHENERRQNIKKAGNEADSGEVVLKPTNPGPKREAFCSDRYDVALGAAALLAAPDSYPRSLELAELSHKEQEQRLSADLHSAVVAIFGDLAGDFGDGAHQRRDHARDGRVAAPGVTRGGLPHQALARARRAQQEGAGSPSECRPAKANGGSAGGTQSTLELARRQAVATSRHSHATHSPPSFHRARLISLRQQAEELSGRRLSEGIRQALHSAEEQAARDRAARHHHEANA